MGRALDWKTDNLALQNIQARVRGPGAWLLANVEGKLLLTTSNRSEAAAGYATMDGDTCGGSIQRLRLERPEVPRDVLAGWIERFFTLFARNQWKRERYAPSFHLDDENLDPRSGCRFPILSGGFARELRALRAFLNPPPGGQP